MMIQDRSQPSGLFILVLLASALSACTGPHSTTSKAATGPLPSTAVGIADFKTVAGVWEGILLWAAQSSG